MLYSNNTGNIEFLNLPNNHSRKARIYGTLEATASGIRKVVLINRDTINLIGSSIVNEDGTWEVNTEFPTDSKITAICFDESSNFNAAVFDRESLCYIDFDYDYLDKSLIDYRPIFRYEAPMTFNSNPYNCTRYIEDVKTTATKFMFDTVGVSGRLYDNSNNTITTSGTKIGAGSIVGIDGEISEISNVTDYGLSNSSININALKNGHSYTTQILGDSSCILFMPLVKDLNGYGYDVSKLLVKSLLWLDGRDSYTKSLGVKATSRYTTCTFQDVKLGSSDYTISFWFYYISSNSISIISQELAIDISYDNAYFNVRTNNNGGTAYTATTQCVSSLTTNTWYHFVVASGSSGITIWRNGTQVFTNTINNTVVPSTAEINKANRLSLNGTPSLGYVGSYYNCSQKLCMVRIFNKKVNATEASTLYNEAYTSGGTGVLNYIYNTLGNSSVRPIRKLIQNATIVDVNSTIKSPIISIDKISSNNYVSLNACRTIYVGNHVRGMLMDGNKNFSTGYPNLAFSDVITLAQYSGGFLVESISNDSVYLTKLYFQITTPTPMVMTGMLFKLYNYSAYYDYPDRLDVYTSMTGRFMGEEIYRGTVTMTGFVAYNELINWSAFEFFCYGKYFRFNITRRSCICNTGENNVAFIGIRNVVFEVESQTHPEAMKARSIVIDIADNYGGTIMGLTKALPTLMGEPVSTRGWSFYSTSYLANTYNVPAKVFSAGYSPKGDTSNSWLSNTITTNQRLIAVAPEEFEFDDVHVVNYHANFYSNTNYGARNTKIRISPYAITDTTYNATISGSQTIFNGQLQQMYTSSTYSAQMEYYEIGIGMKVGGYIGSGSKTISARSVAFDFSKNLGDPLYMGVRKIEFFLKGVRVYNASSWTVQVSSGNATYGRNTFNTSISTTGVYTSSYSWKSAVSSVTDQRLSVLFDGIKSFDAIRIHNHTNSSVTSTYEINMGIADFTLYGSLNTMQPPTTFGSSWTDSFLIVPKTFVSSRTKTVNYNNRDVTYHQIGRLKRDTWTARSVVLDIHSNHGESGVGLKNIAFERYDNTIPFEGWAVYATHYDTGFNPEYAFQQNNVPYACCVTGESWYYSGGAPIRLIVVFNETKSFSNVEITNWWMDSGTIDRDRNKGVNEVTITITDSVLNASDNVYGQNIMNGTTIFSGSVAPVPKSTHSSPTLITYQQPAVIKESIYYSNIMELILQSNAANGSTTFNDGAYRSYSIGTSGTISHSNEQYIIGISSIKTYSGFLTVSGLRGRDIEHTFSISMWIYATSTSGDKGLFSRWGTSGNYSYMLSVNNGYLEFKYSTNGTAITTYTGTIPINSNQWTWVEVRRDGDYLYLFNGGLLSGTFNISSSVIYQGNSQVVIGSYNESVSNCFQGYLQNVILRTGGAYNNVPATGPLVFETMTPTMPTTISGIVCNSISFDNNTYKVYNEGWRSIATCDPNVHGYVGDNAWYYRDNDSVWSKSNVYSVNNAISKATEYTNNAMNYNILNTLSGTNYCETGGYTISGAAPSIATTFSRNSKYVSLGTNDITVNDKKYWVSSAIPVKSGPLVVSNTIMDWTFTRDAAMDYEADNIYNRISVYNWVDSAGWVQCERGGQIPALPIGSTTSGVNLYFKSEIDMSSYTYKYRRSNPTIYMEIY